MTKKQTSRKRSFALNSTFILWVIVLLLVVAQGLSAWHIMKLKEYGDNSDISMMFLLRRAEEDRYKQPVIDISENRVYIPEARIYLPLTDASRDMRYEYRDYGVDSKSKVVYFSTSSVVGMQTGAQYESCDKMVTLVSPQEAQVPSGNVAGSIAPTKDDLSDMYIHPSESCWDKAWYSNLTRELKEAVKEAKSY